MQIDFSGYISGIVSFLARNFYTMKMIALALAFCINLMLLFYKVWYDAISRKASLPFLYLWLTFFRLFRQLLLKVTTTMMMGTTVPDWKEARTLQT